MPIYGCSFEMTFYDEKLSFILKNPIFLLSEIQFQFLKNNKLKINTVLSFEFKLTLFDENAVSSSIIDIFELKYCGFMFQFMETQFSDSVHALFKFLGEKSLLMS